MAFISLPGSMALAEDLNWASCHGRDSQDNPVAVSFTGSFLAAASLSSRAFVDEMVAWDGSDDLDSALYDAVLFGDIGNSCIIDGRSETKELFSVSCRASRIGGNYSKSIPGGLNGLIMKPYGEFRYDLIEVESGVYQAHIRVQAEGKSDFVFTQEILGLQCTTSQP